MLAHGGPHAHGVSTVELLADRPQLTLLEFADGEPAPPVGHADDGGVHELQHRPLPEGCGMIFVRRRSSRKSSSRLVSGMKGAVPPVSSGRTPRAWWSRTRCRL